MRFDRRYRYQKSKNQRYGLDKNYNQSPKDNKFQESNYQGSQKYS